MIRAAAVAAIRAGAEKAVAGDRKSCLLKLPEHVVLKVVYGNPTDAYRHSWYPGASHVGDRTIRFETGNYFDVLRMLNYVS
jgi:D-amino peptidase